MGEGGEEEDVASERDEDAEESQDNLEQDWLKNSRNEVEESYEGSLVDADELEFEEEVEEEDGQQTHPVAAKAPKPFFHPISEHPFSDEERSEAEEEEGQEEQRGDEEEDEEEDAQGELEEEEEEEENEEDASASSRARIQLQRIPGYISESEEEIGEMESEEEEDLPNGQGQTEDTAIVLSDSDEEGQASAAEDEEEDEQEEEDDDDEPGANEERSSEMDQDDTEEAQAIYSSSPPRPIEQPLGQADSVGLAENGNEQAFADFIFSSPMQVSTTSAPAPPPAFVSPARPGQKINSKWLPDGSEADEGVTEQTSYPFRLSAASDGHAAEDPVTRRAIAAAALFTFQNADAQDATFGLDPALQEPEPALSPAVEQSHQGPPDLRASVHIYSQEAQVALPDPKAPPPAALAPVAASSDQLLAIKSLAGRIAPETPVGSARAEVGSNGTGTGTATPSTSMPSAAPNVSTVDTGADLLAIKATVQDEPEATPAASVQVEIGSAKQRDSIDLAPDSAAGTAQAASPAVNQTALSISAAVEPTAVHTGAELIAIKQAVGTDATPRGSVASVTGSLPPSANNSALPAPSGERQDVTGGRTMMEKEDGIQDKDFVGSSEAVQSISEAPQESELEAEDPLLSASLANDPRMEQSSTRKDKHEGAMEDSPTGNIKQTSDGAGIDFKSDPQVPKSSEQLALGVSARKPGEQAQEKTGQVHPEPADGHGLPTVPEKRIPGLVNVEQTLGGEQDGEEFFNFDASAADEYPATAEEAGMAVKVNADEQVDKVEVVATETIETEPERESAPDDDAAKATESAADKLDVSEVDAKPPQAEAMKQAELEENTTSKAENTAEEEGKLTEAEIIESLEEHVEDRESLPEPTPLPGLPPALRHHHHHHHHNHGSARPSRPSGGRMTRSK